MKTLYESILSTTNAGKYKLIEKFLISKKIVKTPGEYKLNSNNEIVFTDQHLFRGVQGLSITYDDEMQELPKYIRFADDDKLVLSIYFMTREVKSLQGLPHSVAVFKATSPRYNMRMPELDINVSQNVFLSGIKGFNDVHIHFTDVKNDIKSRFKGNCDLYTGLHIDGNIKLLDFVNDFNYGDGISKLLSRRAPMNKRNDLNAEVQSDAIDDLKQFLKPMIDDLSSVDEIGYTQQSKIVHSKNGLWYRTKNW